MTETTSFPRTAIVLAGGFGTRLRSVIREVPKPMAPIGDHPFLMHVLDYLAAQGLTKVLLAVGYLGEQIETCFGESHGPLQLSYSYEIEPLGTGGAVAQALQKMDSADPVWVVNGDTFFDCDLSAVAKTHFACHADVTLALRQVDDADRYGLVQLDDHQRIRAFREKQPGSAGLINAGIYLLRPDALRQNSPSHRFSLEKEVFEARLDELHLVGSPQSGYFIDIGIPADYAKAQAYFVA